MTKAKWRNMADLKRSHGAVLGLRAQQDGTGYGVFVGIKYDIASKGPDWLLNEWAGKSARCIGWMPLPKLEMA